MARSVYVLLNRHGDGFIQGTTTDHALARTWKQEDPPYRHIVATLLGKISIYEPEGPLAKVRRRARSAPGGDGTVVLVLFERHGDGHIHGTTVSASASAVWQRSDPLYRHVVATQIDQVKQGADRYGPEPRRG